MRASARTALIMLSVLLSSCGTLITSITSDISVFHRMPPTLTNATKYSFLRLKGQETSLEHASYEEFIRNDLGKHNFREVQFQEAEVVVIFFYGITQGRQEISSIPIFGQTGISSSHTYGGLYNLGAYPGFSGTTTYVPSYGIIGSMPYSSTEYTRYLSMSIYKRPKTDKEKLEKVYEGKVISSGSSNQLPKIAPYMIRALFKNFPGDNGRTETVTMPFQ